MAGLSKITDGYVLDCFISLQNIRKNDFRVDLDPKGCVGGGEKDELRCLFEKFVSVFLSEICGTKYIRPLPPMLANGQSVDLFMLYSLVREKGGYEVACANGLWDSVAKEAGFGLGVASGLKLIYVKYLDTLDKWMKKSVKDCDLKGWFEDCQTIQSVFMMDMESVPRGFPSDNSDQEKKDGETMCNGGGVRSFGGLDEGGKGDCGDKHFENSVVEKCGSGKKIFKDDEVQGVMKLDGEKNNEEITVDADEGDACFKGVVDEVSSRKRKRDFRLSLLNWVKNVAKDPCDPVLGSLPERSKWKYHSNELERKQVLLARESMSQKRNTDSNDERSIWKKKQRMHPTMYEDHSGSEISRFSRRIRNAKESRAVSLKKAQGRASSESSSSGGLSDLDELFDKPSDSRSADALIGLWINNYSRKRTPLGPNFQATVPEWTDDKYESDSKWLGKRIWPQEKGANLNNLIERDRIGFGRHDLCGCEFQGSFECVKFHVNEKRFKIKLELGIAFYHWHMDKMGEEVAQSWDKADEKKFESITKSNPIFEGKSFWDEIYTLFPYKRREQLVSYYFNVFLLRRRGQQNRCNPVEINSDDDEPEFESITNCIGHGVMKPVGSIYCSPMKTHLNFR